MKRQRAATVQPVGHEHAVAMPKHSFRNEADVKNHVKKLLEAHAYFWWMPAANAFGKSGAPDIMAIKAGVFLGIETKFGGREVTPMQKAFLNSINRESAFGMIVHERNIAWLDVWLQAFTRSTVRAIKGEQATDEDGALMLNALRILQSEIDTTT